MFKRLGLLALVLGALAMTDENCNGVDDELDKANVARETRAIQLCIDRGGIPIVERKVESANFIYDHLTGCEFPCSQLKGEK